MCLVSLIFTISGQEGMGKLDTAFGKSINLCIFRCLCRTGWLSLFCFREKVSLS